LNITITRRLISYQKSIITGDVTMLLNNKQSVLIGLVLFMTGLIASCQSIPPLATNSAPGISVGITDDLCPNLIVQVGQQVTWTNQGRGEHVVLDITVEGESQFDSGILKPGDNFMFTFSLPESYTYACSEDGELSGTITVNP
jgi:hypothetical protein